MAKESGLVVAIGEWVLEEACRQAVTWSRTFGSTPRVAVNGSGRHLGKPSFVSHVAEVLASTGMTLRSL
jgi:EAL domain-containing protein (putative c-di-GMP-specific phosphodiesterase class I)